MVNNQSTLDGSLTPSEPYSEKTSSVDASELEKSLRSISIAEFFEKNKHMLGFDSEARGLVTAIKEGVDNALDAAEDAEILPEISVEITESGKYYTLVIEDNGPGITKEQVPKIFGKLLYGSRFNTRAMSRGQQGIGISAAVLYSQLTSGKAAKITSKTSTNESAEYFELLIDTETNEPEIKVEEVVEWDKEHGTRIELEMEANLRSRSTLLQYVDKTAVSNPHAKLIYTDPKMSSPRVYQRGTDELPQKVEEIKPHPHGVELGTVIKMLAVTDSHSLSGFLQTEFTRVGQKTADDIIDGFKDEWFGREMQWDATKLTVEDATTPKGVAVLKEDIIDAVSRKGQEETAAFAEEICSQIRDVGRVSKSTIEGVVDDAGEAVENKYDTRFGKTVRENTSEAVWKRLTTVIPEDCASIALENTSQTKTDESVKLLASILSDAFRSTQNLRISHRELEELVQDAADEVESEDGTKFGDTSQMNIVNAFWDLMRTVPSDPPLVREVVESRDMASSLLHGMVEASVMAPPTKCLSPITPDVIEAGLRKEYDADFYAATTREASVYSGEPFIVEAGLAYGGSIQSEGTIQVARFANRVPLVYQQGACATSDVISSINWQNYFTGTSALKQTGGSGIPTGPLIVLVHVGSTNVPFTSESKDALASVPEIEHEVEQAVREVARKLKSHIKKERSRRERQQKANVIAKLLPEMTEKFATVSGKDTPDVEHTLARIMNNVYVTNTQDGLNHEFTIHNHAGTSETVTIEARFDSEPTNIPSNAEVNTEGTDWSVRYTETVPKGKSETISCDCDGELLDEITVSV